MTDKYAIGPSKSGWASAPTALKLHTLANLGLTVRFIPGKFCSKTKNDFNINEKIVTFIFIIYLLLLIVPLSDDS